MLLAVFSVNCTLYLLLVVHTCLLTGEFGIVYKAQLAEMGTHPSLKTVAVKTLKGLEIFQCVSIDHAV